MTTSISRQQVSTLIERDGQVELHPGDDLFDSPRYSLDLAPTRISERRWNTWHVAALWTSMAICVPTYTLGGVLTAYFGLSVFEALMAILLANLIILIPLTLNAVAGTRYGVPFPVLLRSSFGITGSNVPALIRALVACGWFGIQTMFGGMAISLLFGALSESWRSLGSAGDVIGFVLFGAMNLYVVIRGFESIKWLETLSAPVLLLVSLALLWWALGKVSVAELLASPPTRPAGESTVGHFLAGVTAMVGYWATLSLNIPDFSRYVKSQRAQVVGQIMGLPLTMFLFAALGVVMTAASPTLVGYTISDPVTLIGAIGEPWLVIVAMILIILATLSTNTAANVVSPTNDLQNLAPRLISRNRAVMLTGLIGLLLMSHELLKRLGVIVSDVSVEAIYSNWLLAYSSLLGPIAGVMVVDYFVVRKQRLDVIGLYRDGVYPAWNAAGFIAFCIPAGLSLIAIATGRLGWFYDYGWFTGSISGGLLYWACDKFSRRRAVSGVASNA
ncbi:NCS1 family nucleobase:cation symporter-1 [Halotalea alkalilenta]|uniref:Nitrate reductase n=1 Tax=Halotalea alkalilenta TaxID=376489 RepID=A0A172YGT9_9GAMM|nr:NCS1 family nucleobase:cation symporter-1 [Halotalea alkalilenta]ANF58478.1 nitrate reductase [Halotalea alkalilenta]